MRLMTVLLLLIRRKLVRRKESEQEREAREVDAGLGLVTYF